VNRTDSLRSSSSSSGIVLGTASQDAARQVEKAGPSATRTSQERAWTWLRNRLEDEVLIDRVSTALNKSSSVGPPSHCLYAMVVRNFVSSLLEKESSDGLKAFMTRLRRSKDTHTSPADEGPHAAAQLAAWLQPLKLGGTYQRRQAMALESALDELLKQDENQDLMQDEVANLALRNASKLRKLLPASELDLIRSVETAKTFPDLILFSGTLLRDGHGGIVGWLEMYKDGRGNLARQLFNEKLVITGRDTMAAVKRLQVADGIKPKLTVRCKRFAINPARPSGSGPAQADPGERQGTPLNDAMTPADALQWFKNRKDDARLIDVVYTRHSSSNAYQLKDGARYMRVLMNGLLKEDSKATLREFLERFSSKDEEKKDKAQGQASAIAANHSKGARGIETTLFRALEQLAALRGGSADVEDKEFSLFQKSGTPASYLLPPDDSALISSMRPSPGRRRAATYFSIALLEKGVGGLSQWISMSRDGRNEEAEKLLQDYAESGVHQAIRDFVITAADELLAGAPIEGGQGLRHSGTTGKRSRSKGKPPGDNEVLADDSRASRRSRSERGLGPALRRNSSSVAPQEAPEVTMSFEEAATWHRNRLDDDLLIDYVLHDKLKESKESLTCIEQASRSLRKFAKALSEADKGASLSAFLTRTRGLQGEEGQGEDDEVSSFLLGWGNAKRMREEASAFKKALKTLRDMGDEELDAKREEALKSRPASQELAMQDLVKLRNALPRQDLALIEGVSRSLHGHTAIVRFSSELLLAGYGGLKEWLQMYKDGREDLARRLLAEKLGAPGRGALASIDALQTNAGIDPGLRLRIQGTKSYTADLSIEPRSGAETTSEFQRSAIQRTMTRAESVQWFRNRKDDAALIDGNRLVPSGQFPLKR